MNTSDDTISLRFETCVAATDRARLLRLLDGREIWFPVSQCSDLEDVERGEAGEFSCPAWLAEAKGVD